MKRWLALALAFVLCLGMLPGAPARAAEALSLDRVKALLNAEPLYPQRTGYPALDAKFEELLAPYEGRDTYTKIKVLYDWTVTEVDYSWAGYSQDWAPAYDCFTLTYDLEYETGLPKSCPEDMIYRAWHMLTAKTGVCYDWGILFALMARYVGIESYVHTGILRIGDWTGHHGWTELRLGGKNYIFDAQQDNRELKDLFVPDPHLHFGIPADTAARWTQAVQENGPRDRSMLPVSAERIRVAKAAVTASRSGEVAGAGEHPWGEEVTLSSAGDLPVAGWYDRNGKLLSAEPEYTVTLLGNMELLALFEGDVFVDIQEGWYLSDVLEAVNRGLIYGTTACTFEPEGSMTRAMLAALLARAEGADTSQSPQCPFEDVKQGSWYAEAVNWAYENGLVYGVTDTRFAPSDPLTREQAAVMLMRYLQKKGVPTIPAEQEFADSHKISPFAREGVSAAKGIGILSGYKDGTVRPQNVVTRSEGTALLLRAIRYRENAAVWPAA